LSACYLPLHQGPKNNLRVRQFRPRDTSNRAHENQPSYYCYPGKTKLNYVYCTLLHLCSICVYSKLRNQAHVHPTLVNGALALTAILTEPRLRFSQVLGRIGFKNHIATNEGHVTYAASNSSHEFLIVTFLRCWYVLLSYLWEISG